jgi:nicotinate phosphoribosyltransferase
VFPHEPLVRVVGPLIQSQIVETALLNLVNFQTLIATKAARIVAAARGDPVFDFGLRRAQGIDGGLSASRAAYVGGCAGTSNVLAGRLYGIPVKGTHAHSWIMCFDDEPQAFQAYAEAMPNNCVFLVDTYDSIQGVKNAVEAGRRLRERGHRMIGIRLDSGELGPLSVEARRILDEAGFSDAIIFASNDLDEHRIARLKQQGAAVGVWGVGTRLVTAFDDPALGGVYKLTAVENDEGRWQDRLKISEETIKTSIPGILQVRRFFEGGRAAGDVLYDRRDGIQGDCTAIDRVDPARRSTFGSSAESTDLLVPVLRRGKRVAAIASLDAARERAREQLAQVASAFKRLDEPERYPVGLDERLHDRRARMIEEERGPKP